MSELLYSIFLFDWDGEKYKINDDLRDFEVEPIKNAVIESFREKGFDVIVKSPNDILFTKVVEDVVGVREVTFELLIIEEIRR